MTDHYYNAKDLARFSEMGEEAGPLWEKFNAWYTAVLADGSLSEREMA